MKHKLILLTAIILVGRTLAAPILTETFDYPDGPLVTVSDGLWITHSGTAEQANVSAGALNLTAAQSEDVSRLLADGPYTSGTVYASFVLHVSELPTSAGTYFAHFNASGFRGRVFVGTADAAPDRFRVGVANGATTPSAMVAADLLPGEDYRLVLRLVLDPVAATLWVNPAAESSLLDRADATDVQTSVAITAFGFRQNSGLGAVRVDDLSVGSSFDDVLPGSEVALAIAADQGGLLISWPADTAGYVLESTAGFTGLWSPYEDQGSVSDGRKIVTIVNASGTRFFRLAKP